MTSPRYDHDTAKFSRVRLFAKGLGLFILRIGHLIYFTSNVNKITATLTDERLPLLGLAAGPFDWQKPSAHSDRADCSGDPRVAPRGIPRTIDPDT